MPAPNFHSPVVAGGTPQNHPVTRPKACGGRNRRVSATKSFHPLTMLRCACTPGGQGGHKWTHRGSQGTWTHSGRGCFLLAWLFVAVL